MKAEPAAPRLSRRALLRAGAGLALALASGVALVRRSGYEISATDRDRLVALRPAEYVVVRALARRVCAADRAGVVSPDETDVAGFVDAYVSRMAPKMRRDLLRFLSYVEQVAPATVGFASRFSFLGDDEQDAVLRSIEASRVGLLRGGFEGVKALLFMGYYRDPRTWSILGYGGPMVSRTPT